MRFATSAICLLLLAVAAEARKPHCTFRLHLEANANDTEIFSTRMRSAVTGKPVVIEKLPRISEQDVVAFYPYGASDGSYGVLLKLSDHGKLALDTMSVERRGGFVYIFVNGRPLSELQIDRRISDGKVYIASGLTVNDLALMRKEWPPVGKAKK